MDWYDGLACPWRSQLACSSATKSCTYRVLFRDRSALSPLAFGVCLILGLGYGICLLGGSKLFGLLIQSSRCTHTTTHVVA